MWVVAWYYVGSHTRCDRCRAQHHAMPTAVTKRQQQHNDNNQIRLRYVRSKMDTSRPDEKLGRGIVLPLMPWPKQGFSCSLWINVDSPSAEDAAGGGGRRASPPRQRQARIGRGHRVGSTGSLVPSCRLACRVTTGIAQDGLRSLTIFSQHNESCRQDNKDDRTNK